MSTTLVSDKVINIIVSHVHLNPDLGWSARNFLDAIESDTGDFYIDLGAALFALNIEAVEIRHGKGQAKTFRALDYKFRLETASQLKVYDAIAELKYQLCEGEIPSTPLYRELTALKAAVADGLVKGVAEREREMADELENSLYARCEQCCKGIDHDEKYCGAPTARRLLIGIGRVYDKRKVKGRGVRL